MAQKRLRAFLSHFFTEGVVNAVYLYDPTRENGIPERPQTLRYSEIKNNISLAYAQSEAERIPNRPHTEENVIFLLPAPAAFACPAPARRRGIAAPSPPAQSI